MFTRKHTNLSGEGTSVRHSPYRTVTIHTIYLCRGLSNEIYFTILNELPAHLMRLMPLISGKRFLDTVLSFNQCFRCVFALLPRPFTGSRQHTHPMVSDGPITEMLWTIITEPILRSYISISLRRGDEQHKLNLRIITHIINNVSLPFRPHCWRHGIATAAMAVLYDRLFVCSTATWLSICLPRVRAQIENKIANGMPFDSIKWLVDCCLLLLIFGSVKLLL